MPKGNEMKKYFDKYGIRYFLEFPKKAKCPICGTKDKDYCVLIGIDGTANDGIEEGCPVHIHCLINKNLRYAKAHNLIYQRCKHEKSKQ